jgi:hypothetical protein
LVLQLLSTLLAFMVLREPSREPEITTDLQWEISSRRTRAAQASLHGIVLTATTSRRARRETS